MSLTEKIKRTWEIRGDRHLVVAEGYQLAGDETGWTVGIYVYPGHPAWDDALAIAMTGDSRHGVIADWPFHLGITLRRVNRVAQNGTAELMRNPPLSSIYLAADYNHLHDWWSECRLEDGLPDKIGADALALHMKAANASVVLEVAGINAEASDVGS
jgi:hypothetical protein